MAMLVITKWQTHGCWSPLPGPPSISSHGARIRSAYWNGVQAADEDDNVDQAAVFEPRNGLMVGGLEHEFYFPQ